MTETKKRGRPRKATQEQMTTINDGLRELGLGDTLEDFAANFANKDSVAKFATSLSQQMNVAQQLALAAGHSGTLQPILSQKLFQNINVNPIATTSDDLERALLNPSNNAEYLQSISQYLAYTVGNYNRAIYYFSQIKEFNYELLPCDSVSELDEAGKKEFYKGRKHCLDKLKKLNVKYQFAKIDLECMYSGVVTYYIQELSDSIQFVQLPSSYVYLVSPWAYGYKATLDLTIFDSYIGIDTMAIPELYEAYKKFVDLRKNGLDGRKLSDGELTTVQYYPLDPDHFWTFTFDPVHPDRVPPLASSFGAALDALSYRKILKNKVALDLFKVIALKIPLRKDDSRTVLTYQEASQIAEAIQSLLPENIRVYSSPFDSDEIQTSQDSKFESLISMATDGFNTTSGLAAGLFGGGELKQSQALLVSADVDYSYVKHMYDQYANCINYILARCSKTHKFVVNMFGNLLRHNEDVRLYGEMMASRNAPASRFFAAMGYEPMNVLPLLDMENDMGIKDKMTPLTSAFQMSKGTAGRNKLPSDQISPSTEEGREYASGHNQPVA